MKLDGEEVGSLGKKQREKGNDPQAARKLRNAINKTRYEITRQENEIHLREHPPTPEETVGEHQIYMMWAWRDKLKSHLASLEKGEYKEYPDYQATINKASAEFEKGGTAKAKEPSKTKKSSLKHVVQTAIIAMNEKTEIDNEPLDDLMYQEIIEFAFSMANPSQLLAKEGVEKAHARIKARRPEFFGICEKIARELLVSSGKTTREQLDLAKQIVTNPKLKNDFEIGAQMKDFTDDQILSYMKTEAKTRGETFNPKGSSGGGTGKKKGGFVPNAYWAEVNTLKKGGMEEEAAKSKAKENMKQKHKDGDSMLTEIDFDSHFTGHDAVQLVNQPVTREGVLRYGSVAKLKRWTDIQKNIGRVVPIIDEHPRRDNGRRGLFNGETMHGLAKLKACPKTKKTLCFDGVLFDGAPNKFGYSPGMGHDNLQEPGEYNGTHYDMIQAGLVIDHVALTDYMRDQKIRKVAGDSDAGDSDIKNEEKNIGYFQNYIGSDSYDLSGDTEMVSFGNGVVHINSVSHDTFRLAMSSTFSADARFQEIMAHLQKHNPDVDDSELVDQAEMMYLNEQKLKEFDSENESNMGNEEILKLEKDIMKLEHENEKITSDRDSLAEELKGKEKLIADQDSRIKSLEAEKKVLEDEKNVDYKKKCTEAFDSLKGRGFSQEKLEKMNSNEILASWNLLKEVPVDTDSKNPAPPKKGELPPPSYKMRILPNGAIAWEDL